MKVLFEDKEVQQLLDGFQKLVGVRIAVFDTDFNELYSSPKSKSNFCSYIRAFKVINDACKFCDQKAFKESMHNKDTYIYKCHLGLYEAVTPIFDNNQILGYVMVGQILGKGPMRSKLDKIIEQFPVLNTEKEIFSEGFNELKQMSVEEIEAASRIMKACASSIWLQHIIEIERTPVCDRIKNYIQDNFRKQLDTAKVCADLNISKTTIYNNLKKDYNLSLNQYISKVRLSEARKIIKETNKSIGDIAFDVGFDDYNYFSRKFKELFNITPTNFRRTL